MRVARRGIEPFAFLVTLLLAAATPVAGQQTTGRVEGRVVDAETGQPLAGAQVSIVGTRYGNVTNEEGYYFINNVPAGVHDVVAQFIGRQTVTITEQRILAGQSTQLDFRLPSQALALEAITVEGERTPLLPRDQVISKTAVTSDVTDALPVESVRDVVALQPGVVDTDERLGQVIRGGRPGEAAVYIDGVLVRNFATGSQGDISLQSNAVEEVDILLGGFGAEYGQAQSGVINLVSRGGGTEWSGAIAFETDQLEIENSYGYSRLEASLSGPILGERLGFSVAGVFVGEEDREPTFMGREAGVLPVRDIVTGNPLSVPVGQTRFFRPTGRFTEILDGGETVLVPDFEEIRGLGAKKPWNNRDEYNVNLTLRGTPTANTRYNAGVTLARIQQRLFDPQWQFRPQSMPARRDKSWLLRGGLEQVLFQSAERSASLKINIGYGQDEFVQGPLGETLADTLDVLKGDLYPMAGDFLGFTFKDFKFPFEGHYTIDRYLARLDSVKADPSKSYLVPFETLINPATGQPFTVQELTDLFDQRYSKKDNPFGIQDFLGQGFTAFGYRKERTFSVRADLDWQVNRHNRVALGGEIYRKEIENLTGFGQGIGGLSNVSPTFQNVYEAAPIIAGMYAKNRLDLGDIVVELGLRLDMFDSDVVYPEIPGFVLPTVVNGELVTPKFIEQKTQWQLSPRLGVGFPVTENTQFRLSYGHFTQVPPLNQLFSGINGDLNKVNLNATFGRPIEFGRTIGYEAGFTHLLDPQTVIDISGYSREKQGDIAYRTEQFVLPGRGNSTIRFLTNADFGYIRGVDARITRRFSNVLNVQTAYSFLTTRSTGSDPTDFINTLGRQTDHTGRALPPAQAAFPTDFQQTHTISLSGVVNTPADFLSDRGALNTVLRNVTASLALQARSGTPYTRTRTPGATSDPTLGPDPIFREPINQSRLPWSYMANLRLGRAFALRGSRVMAYTDVRNLFNFKNIERVFSLTGQPTNPGLTYIDNNTLGSARGVAAADIVIDDMPEGLDKHLTKRREQLFGDGDGIVTRQEQQQISIQSFLASGYGTILDTFPGYYFGEPRQIRLGLEWTF